MEEYYKATDIVYQPLNPRENINWRYFGSTNKLFESLASGSLFIGSAINERRDLNEQPAVCRAHRLPEGHPGAAAHAVPSHRRRPVVPA